jgi:hypothetical protein
MWRLMRALWKGGRAHVKCLLENPELKVGREEVCWQRMRGEGCLCLFSGQVCVKREISLGDLRFEWKMGSCQEEREHRLASLPRQTQNRIATRAKAKPSQGSAINELSSFSAKKTCQPVRTSAKPVNTPLHKAQARTPHFSTMSASFGD